MKTCTKCQQEKPLDCFSKSIKSASGLRSNCKSCANEALHKYRESVPGGAASSVPRWTPEQDATLIAKWPHDELKTIAAAVNRTAEGVAARAKKLGLPPRSVYRIPVCGKEEPKNHPLTRFQEKQLRKMRAEPIVRDPFVAILFGACEAIKATVLPSHVYRQSMSIDEEELAA